MNLESNRLNIFLVFSPTIEILVSRIIESNFNDNSKKEILILHPRNYTPNIVNDVKIYCFENDFPSKTGKKINGFKKYLLYSKIQFILYKFRKFSINFGKRIYARLGNLPVSLSKINQYSQFIYNLDLENKELFLYTPNVKIHIFQILIFYKKDFNYRLMEEGSGSFKNINETELLFNKNIKLFVADILSNLILKFILLLRTFFDFLKIFEKSPKKSISLLINYINLPIFNNGLFYLNKIKPKSIHKISPQAFSSHKLRNIKLYSNKSIYEIKQQKRVRSFLNKLNLENIFIVVLSGDNLNILKNEFKFDAFIKYKNKNVVIRPHPKLYNLLINQITDYLDIDLPDELIDLSEKLRNIPIEFMQDIQNINIVFLGQQKTSLLRYSRLYKEENN